MERYLEISIEGMSCNHCVKAVQEALKDLGGKNISVSLESKSAKALLESNDDAIRAALDDAGYDVPAITEISK